MGVGVLNILPITILVATSRFLSQPKKLLRDITSGNLIRSKTNTILSPMTSWVTKTSYYINPFPAPFSVSC